MNPAVYCCQDRSILSIETAHCPHHPRRAPLLKGLVTLDLKPIRRLQAGWLAPTRGRSDALTRPWVAAQIDSQNGLRR